MKNKKIIRLFTAALAVALCATAFAVPAFAGGGEGEPYYAETAGAEADPSEDAEAPEVTVTDEEDPAGDDRADDNKEADGDALDQIAELLGGGEAFAYIKFIRPKQAAKASADPDDYDFADEEEYINEDEPEQPEDGPKESEDTL